jgi:hypothetical protein
MAEGRQRDEWWRTSELMAWIGDAIGGAVAGKDHKAIDPRELNPFLAKRARQENAATANDEAIETARKSGAWKESAHGR